MMANPYYAYYAAQMGEGASPFYYRSKFSGVQGGRGWFGDLFRNAWGYLRPLLGDAVQHVGKEAISTTTNMVKDAVAQPTESMGRIAKRRGKEGLANIAKGAAKAFMGSGRKRRKPAKGTQLRASRRRKQTVFKPQIRDIFAPPTP